MRHIAILAITVVVACEIARAQDLSSVLQANETAAGGTAWSGKASLTLEYAYSGQGMTGKQLC
jgi:hypothetical protein